MHGKNEEIKRFTELHKDDSIADLKHQMIALVQVYVDRIHGPEEKLRDIDLLHVMARFGENSYGLNMFIGPHMDEEEIQKNYQYYLQIINNGIQLDRTAHKMIIALCKSSLNSASMDVFNFMHCYGVSESVFNNLVVAFTKTVDSFLTETYTELYRDYKDTLKAYVSGLPEDYVVTEYHTAFLETKIKSFVSKCDVEETLYKWLNREVYPEDIRQLIVNAAVI